MIDRESWEAHAGELDPTGIWEGTLTGMLGAGLSEDEGPLELQLWRDENGNLTGTMRNPMQTVALPQVEFDASTGHMRTSYGFRDIEIVVQGKLAEGQLSGSGKLLAWVSGTLVHHGTRTIGPAPRSTPRGRNLEPHAARVERVGLPTDEAPIALEVTAEGSKLEASFMAMGQEARSKI